MKADRGKVNPFDFDLRVRERNLAKGVLDAKGLERYLSELPDVEASSEPIGVAQPALSDSDDDESDLDSPFGSE